ncbi:Vitamin B12 import ATP-binding protein BtuD [Streptomyces microflavus]
MIAMALACDPRLIVADEPTTALDVMIQAQILRLIEQLVADQDVGLIMISHDLAVLADTCDRLSVMYAGRVVEEGPARQVYAEARHPYGKALSAAFPRIGDLASRRAPRGLPGDPPDPAALPGGCTFHPRCPVALDSCATEDQELREAGGDRAGGLRAGRRSHSGPIEEHLMSTAPLVSTTPLLSAEALDGSRPCRPARAARAVGEPFDLDIQPGEIVR